MASTTQSLKNKTVLITGATSGIGYELVLELLKSGAKVIAPVRNPKIAGEKFLNVRHWDERKLLFFSADLSRPHELFKKSSCFLENNGGAQVIIHSAVLYGFGRRKEFMQAALEEWQTVMSVNFFSQIELTRSFLATKNDSQPARIVALSSPVALETAPKRLPYATSKAAAFSFFSGLAREFVGRNITISQVIPLGKIRTPGIEARRPKGFDFSGYRGPAEVAKPIMGVLKRTGIENMYQVLEA